MSMTDPARVLADPAWLPHRYDAPGQRVQFVRLSREEMRALTFLADHQPQDHASTWLRLAALTGATQHAGPIHFVFHTAFCRSTLLTRALDLPGAAMGLSEPGILNDLAMAGQGGSALVAPVCALLSRPQGPGEAVVVKPSNVVNGLIPALLDARPQARAVLMTSSLEAFLRSVHKKGANGRRWVRRLFGHVQGYAPLDLGMSANDLFEASDLQIAGLAWFLQQRWFALLLESPLGDRLEVVSADALVDDRLDTLERVAMHFGLGANGDDLRAVADGPLFARHAKLGGDYAEAIAAQAAAAQSEVVEEEVAMVATWIGRVVEQTGLRLPVG